MTTLVHIANDPFDPPVSGADWRNLSISKALQEIGRVETIAIRSLHPAPRRSHRNNPTILDIPDAVCAKIAALTSSARPDFIVIEGVGLLPVIRRLAKEKTAGTIVLDMHNVESALVRETDEAWTIPLLRSPAALLRRRRWKNACDADRAAAGLAAAVFVCSDSDRDRLGALGIDTGPVAVVPNVVPAWVTGAKPGSRKTNERGSPKAVFVGHLRYKPNRAAVQRLIRAIWPLVRKARPDAGLVVAGRTPRNDLLRTATASPGVSVIADPADLVAVYGGADVAVMPLSEGGGTRLKALEALALGLPVVASAKAVEGLGLTAGRHYLAAESDGDFATAILAVFDDPARATAIAEAGRSLIMASHAQNVVDRAVESALGPLRGQTR